MAQVRVEGLREVERALKDLSKATARNVLRRALVKGGAPIAEAAREYAPEDRGDTERSIAVSTRRPKDAPSGRAAFARARRDGASVGQAREAARVAGAQAAFAEAWVGPGRNPQALFQEFGTRHHGAQAFMRPAWDGRSQEALNRISIEIRNEVERAIARARARAERSAAGGATGRKVRAPRSR